jgi:hypothetical protein
MFAQDKSIKPTPVPWTIEKYNSHAHTDRDWTIEHYAEGGWGDVTVCIMRDCRDMEANARLIAAAPELLAACQSLILVDMPDDVRKTVQAAIDKALNGT